MLHFYIQSIAYWLARAHPRRAWLSDDPVQAARTLAFMDHVVGTVHGAGYTRIFTADAYLPCGLSVSERAAWQEAVQARGYLRLRGRPVVTRVLAEEGYR